MWFRDILMAAATRGGGADPDAAAWVAAVVTNGGSVSAARAGLIGSLIGSLKAAGTWALTDDYYLHAAESEVQALTSLKQRRLGTVTAAPTFTQDRGYAFNGTTQYVDTGFIANTHKVAMTGSDMRIASYCGTNVNASGFVAGSFTGSTSNLRLRPRNSNVADAGLNSGLTSAANTDSRGLVVVSRTAGGTFETFRNGASLGTSAPSTGTSLPTHAFYIGAMNNAGTAGSFLAAAPRLVSVGASFSAAQEAAEYAIWQDFLTAIGAQV